LPRVHQVALRSAARTPGAARCRRHGARARTGSLLLLAALAGVGCRTRPADLRLSSGTPVVLVSIDTLRADHLPAYGYKGVETPALDGLRRDALLFERSFAQVATSGGTS
jgi:hypothetical protein